MRVRHPHALHDRAVPGAITVGDENVAVDDAGWFEVDASERWLEHLAERHGVTPDELVYKEDGPPDRESTPAVDPGDLTVANLREAVADIDDAETLRAIRDAEADGKDRTTAREAIDARLAELEG
jgi:hypothetical protein